MTTSSTTTAALLKIKKMKLRTMIVHQVRQDPSRVFLVTTMKRRVVTMLQSPEIFLDPNHRTFSVNMTAVNIHSMEAHNKQMELLQQILHRPSILLLPSPSPPRLATVSTPVSILRLLPKTPHHSAQQSSTLHNPNFLQPPPKPQYSPPQ